MNPVPKSFPFRSWFRPALLILVCLLLASVPAASQEGILGEKVQKDPADEAQIKSRIAYLQKQLAANPKNYRHHYELGNLYVDLEKFTDAERAYKEALKYNPKYKEALVNLGGLHSDAGQHDEAIKLFEAALGIDPEDCKARSNLGNSYYAMERYPDAMYEYMRAVENDPKCYSALYNIAVAFADAGMYREAVNWWEKVVKVAPGTSAARNARENIKLLERFTALPSPSSGDHE